MNNDKYYIKPHIYSVIRFISRFAFLLIIPAFQIAVFKEIKTLQSILTLLGCAIIIIYAFIRRKSEFFLADKDRILINRGVTIKSQKLIKNEKISTLNIKRGLIGGAIFGAAEVFLDVPSTFRDVKTTFYMGAKKAYEIFCEKANVIYSSEFKKIFLSAILWSNSITGFLTLIPLMNNADRLFGEALTSKIYNGISVTEYLIYAGISPAAAVVSNIIIICFFISLAIQINEYFGFKLSEDSNGLMYISRGLFKRNVFIFKPEAVNAICIRQNMYMLPFNLCCSFIETVSSNKIKGDMSLLIPPEKAKVNYEIISQIFKGFNNVCSKKITPPRDAMAAYKYPVFAVAFLISATAVVFSDAGVFGEIIYILLCFILILILLRAVFVIISFKRVSVKINNDYISTLTIKNFYTEENYIPHKKVQKTEISQNIFQRRLNRCNLKIYVFSEKKRCICIKHLPCKEITEILGF
ncbi:MAG: PH domain-containing protein [Clostridiales bacterium]|nr:PH domain-containing protein [Clostridiales bacterium]